MEALDESASSVKLSNETHYTVLGTDDYTCDIFMSKYHYNNIFSRHSDQCYRQITTAYKTLVLKYHPDRNPGNQSAAETYKAVCEAYKVVEVHQQTAKHILTKFLVF